MRVVSSFLYRALLDGADGFHAISRRRADTSIWGKSAQLLGLRPTLWVGTAAVSVLASLRTETAAPPLALHGNDYGVLAPVGRLRRPAPLVGGASQRARLS